MRNTIRSLSTAFLAIGVAACAEFTSGPRPGGSVPATFALAPRFESSASGTAAALAQLGLEFDQVRAIVVRPPSTTLKDTVISFRPGDSPVTLELSVSAVPGDTLVMTLQYRSGTIVLFEGTVKVVARPVNAVGTPTNAVSITVKYTGPGATATKLTLSPGAGTYASGIVTQFTAKAFDAANVEQINAPIIWSVSDTNVAKIDRLSGALTSKVTRGSVTVTATLIGLTQSASVSFVPLSSRLRVVQGAAQTGPPGSQLPLPIIIEAVAPDELPGLGTGLTATFVANSGGSVTPASVAVGPDGRAQSLFTLGTTSPGGIYLYTATVGSLSIIIPEISIVGAPTQVIPSGATTFTMTAGVAPSPLPTLRVADSFGNTVGGVVLQVTVKQGTTQLATFPILSDTIGLINVSAVVPTLAGTFTITVGSGNPGVTFPALVYTVTVIPGAAAQLGFGQQPTNAVVNTSISPAVTVFVQDSYGNTVTSSTSTVSIILDSGTTAGETLTGGAGISAVAGIATFAGLKMNLVKAGVKVIATSAGLTATLSAAFNITP